MEGFPRELELLERTAPHRIGPIRPIGPVPEGFGCSLNLHFEFFARFERLGEGGHQLRNFFQVLQAHDLHRRVHVAVGQADQRAGNAAARPENHVGVGAAVGGQRLVLERDFFGLWRAASMRATTSG